MITTLYNFAKLLRNQESLKVYFSPAKNPFEGREEKGKVLRGIIREGKFKGFELEDFKGSYVPKYLYRPTDPNGTNSVPTLYVNAKNPEKTSKKIRQSILNYGWAFIPKEDLEIAIQDFDEYNFNKDYSYLVTFTIDGKYFGEIDSYKATFAKEAYKPYYEKKYGNTRKENKLCAVTGEISTVFGFVDTLGFTVYSRAFSRNGFNANQAYTMFPVSEKAIPYLEASRDILINKLAANFFGQLKYAIIPHFVIEPDLETAQYIAQKFLKKAAFNVDSKDGEGSIGFVNATEKILHEIIEDGDLKSNEMYYAILFFEQQQAQFKIHLELNDVLPSRISKILKAKKDAEARYRPFTTYIPKNKDIKQHRINLYRLRDYFLTGDKSIQPAFFKLIQSIFTGQAFDDSKLIGLVLNAWQKSFKNNYHDKENTFNFLVKNTLGNLYFLNLLKIFKPEHNMSEQPISTERQDAFSFIDAHPAYFHQDYLKGAFIFGCLVSRLFIEQQGKAFMRELNGLNIDRELVTKKFPKLIAKLRQYKMKFDELEAAAFKYLASYDNSKKVDISFAFTMGLVLQKDFDKFNKINGNNNSKKQDND